MIIHGIDGNNVVTSLLVDSGGRLLVSSVEGKEFAPLVRRAHYETLTLAAGNSTHTVYTVPTNETLQIDFISLLYVGTVLNVRLNFFIDDLTSTYTMILADNLTSGVWKSYPLGFVIDSADIAKVTVVGATLNDDFHCNLYGRRIA